MYNKVLCYNEQKSSYILNLLSSGKNPEFFMHFKQEDNLLKNFYLKPKFFSVIKNYTVPQFVKDLTAGIIVAIIALPLSIALALASGVEPACGVYTAIAAGFIVSFLGGSRVQIAGPTAAFATIVAGIVASQGMDGLILATIIARIILVLMGIFKFGTLIKYIPATITTGFTAGIAVTIFIGQIKDFLGLTYSDGVKPIEALDKFKANWDAISTFSWQALLIGAVCLAILIIYPKFEKRVPPSLIAVIAGALMVAFLPGLDDGVYTIGELYPIPSGLPHPTIGGIDFSFSKIAAVFPNAVTIAVLAAIESLLSCVVADKMIGSRHNSNAELVAQGVGNIASVCFGGIPATGAIARTAANIKNGGRTPVAGMVHAVILLLVLLFLMPLAELIPMPTIAAILFMVAYNMSEWREFRHLVKTAPKSDVTVLVTTFVLTVVFDLVAAIAAGMILTFVLFVKRSASETCVNMRSADSTKTDGLYMIDITGPLFFGAADKLQSIKPETDTKCIIINMAGVSSLDNTAMNALSSLYNTCSNENISIVIADIRPQPLSVMKKCGFTDTLGSEHFCENSDSALALAETLV